MIRACLKGLTCLAKTQGSWSQCKDGAQMKSKKSMSVEAVTACGKEGLQRDSAVIELAPGMSVSVWSWSDKPVVS